MKNILTKSTIDPGVSLVLFLRWLSLTNLRVSLWSQASSTPLPPLSPPHTNPLVLTEPCSVLLRHQQQAPTTASRLRPGTSSFRHRASLARSRCTRRPSSPPVQSAVVSALVPLTWPSLLSMSSSAICRSDSSTSLTLFHFQLLFLRFLSPRLEEEIFFFFWEEISRNIIKKINGKISGRTYSVQTDNGNKMSLSLLKHGPDSEPGPSPEGRLCPSFDFFFFFFLRRSFDFIGLPLRIV